MITDKDIFKKFTVANPVLPKLYCLPKILKLGSQTRPIGTHLSILQMFYYSQLTFKKIINFHSQISNYNNNLNSIGLFYSYSPDARINE